MALTGFEIGVIVVSVIIFIIAAIGSTFGIIAYFDARNNKEANVLGSDNITYVHAASTENLSIVPGLTEMDGVILNTNKVLLLKNQNIVVENGIYEYNFDTRSLRKLDDLKLPSMVVVLEGNLNKQKKFLIYENQENVVTVEQFPDLNFGGTGGTDLSSIKPGSIPVLGQNGQWLTLPFELTSLLDSDFSGGIPENSVLSYNGTNWVTSPSPDIQFISLVSDDFNYIADPITTKQTFFFSVSLIDKAGMSEFSLPVITSENHTSTIQITLRDVHPTSGSVLSIIPQANDVIGDGSPLTLMAENQFVNFIAAYPDQKWFIY